MTQPANDTPSTFVPALTIDKKQFCKEVCTFRELMGRKDFWADENAQDLAIKALTACYLSVKTDNKADEEFVVNIFQATMSEYTRREMHASMMKLRA